MEILKVENLCKRYGEKDYINFIEMSDYELGLFIKKMFEP